MASNFFRGTSIEQDGRWGKSEEKMITKMKAAGKFAPILDTKINLKKVNIGVISKWVNEKIIELLGFEDDILIGMVNNMLQSDHLDGKKLQLEVTGFLEKQSGVFVQELWSLLADAQNQSTGIPAAFLKKKQDEILQRQADITAALTAAKNQVVESMSGNSSSSSSYVHSSAHAMDDVSDVPDISDPPSSYEPAPNSTSHVSSNMDVVEKQVDLREKDRGDDRKHDRNEGRERRRSRSRSDSRHRRDSRDLRERSRDRDRDNRDRDNYRYNRDTRGYSRRYDDRDRDRNRGNDNRSHYRGGGGGGRGADDMYPRDDRSRHHNDRSHRDHRDEAPHDRYQRKDKSGSDGDLRQDEDLRESKGDAQRKGNDEDHHRKELGDDRRHKSKNDKSDDAEENSSGQKAAKASKEDDVDDSAEREKKEKQLREAVAASYRAKKGLKKSVEAEGNGNNEPTNANASTTTEADIVKD